MDQSRQRRYPALRSKKTPTLKSNLNFLREGVLILFSSVLWMFTLMAIITVTLTVLGIDLYYVQLVRTILNITQEEILYIFGVIGINVVIFFFYLMITYFIGPFRQKGKAKEDETKGRKLNEKNN